MAWKFLSKAREPRRCVKSGRLFVYRKNEEEMSRGSGGAARAFLGACLSFYRVVVSHQWVGPLQVRHALKTYSLVQVAYGG